MSFVNATYVTIWDSASDEVRTNCLIDLTENPPIVKDIQFLDIEGLEILDEEYIELNNGEIVKTFFNEDASVHVENGQYSETE